MRKAALLIMVLLIGIGAANCGLTDESEVYYVYELYTDCKILWNEAPDTAQTENKPVMINFYTDMCPACRKLESDTLSDDELSTYLNNNFICLKSKMTESTLYQNYSNIQYVPTIILASPDGTEIGRMVGAYPPDSFYQYASGVLDQWEP